MHTIKNYDDLQKATQAPTFISAVKCVEPLQCDDGDDEPLKLQNNVLPLPSEASVSAIFSASTTPSLTCTGGPPDFLVVVC